LLSPNWIRSEWLAVWKFHTHCVHGCSNQ
jgi:hypothetical protein